MGKSPWKDGGWNCNSAEMLHMRRRICLICFPVSSNAFWSSSTSSSSKTFGKVRPTQCPHEAGQRFPRIGHFMAIGKKWKELPLELAGCIQAHLPEAVLGGWINGLQIHCCTWANENPFHLSFFSNFWAVNRFIYLAVYLSTFLSILPSSRLSSAFIAFLLSMFLLINHDQSILPPLPYRPNWLESWRVNVSKWHFSTWHDCLFGSLRY